MVGPGDLESDDVLDDLLDNGPSDDLKAYNFVKVGVRHSHLFLMIHGDATFSSLDDFVESVNNDINSLRETCDVKVTLSLARSYLKSKPHYHVPQLFPAYEKFLRAVFGEEEVK